MNHNRDALTGLSNRQYVLEILPGILGHNGQVALILIDVDRLHLFNDQQGHILGDEKITEIAREIETSSGESSLVFRYGGDEFGVILYETSPEKAREIAERIRAQREPVFVEMREKEVPTLMLSLGVAHFPSHAQTPETLFEMADAALWKAKERGRNCVASSE